MFFLDVCIVQSLSGPNPLDLLRSSNSKTDMMALGRYSMYHSRVNALDPAAVFDAATTGNMFQGPTHTPNARYLEAGMLIDHTDGEKQRRKVSHMEKFGRAQDCPKRSRVRWDLSNSETTAVTSTAFATWCDSLEPDDPIPTSKFKCRIVMQGHDVVAGLRALAESGEFSKDIPICVRDAAR